MTHPLVPTPEVNIRRSPWALSLYQVGLAVILGGIFAATLSPYLNTDLWWHLHAGRMIVTSGQIPDQDSLSFTATGRPWLDHEWLAEVIFYLVHRSFGIRGLLFLVASTVALTFFLLQVRMRRRGASPIVILLVMIPAWIATINSIFLRIQPITLLLLALFLLLLDDYSRTRRKAFLIPLPLLMLLWANLHGGFAVGLIVILIYLAGEWIEKTRGESALTSKELFALFICLATSTIMSLGTPGGIDTLAYPFRFITPNFFTDHINESQRTTFADPITIAFELMVLGLLAAACLRNQRIRWPDVLVIVAFTHLGLSQLRHMSVFAVGVAPLLAQYSSDVFRNRLSPMDRITHRPRGALLPALHWAILAFGLLVLGAIAQQFLTNETLRTVERKDYPSAACEYLRAGQFRPNVLADYRWGGYVLWTLNPPFRTFIDGRADTVFSDQIFETYLDIYSLRPGWEQKLDRSATDIVLVEADSRLAAALASSARWRPLYRDRVAAVFGRRGRR